MTDNVRTCYFLFLVKVTLCRFNCQESDDRMASTKIVGDTAAASGEYPGMISLQRRSRSHFCGATLINENHVLTAAHCVTNSNTGAVDYPSSYYVQGNSLTVPPSQNANNQTRDATHIFVHSSYNPNTLVNDIAVIWVSPPFTYTSTFYPTIRIEATPAVNTNCSVAGWGTLYHDGPASNTLQRVNISILDTTQCNQPYGGAVQAGMICAGTWEGGKDSCQGDSGGGMICENRLTGVVSFGIKCAEPGIPFVYTNVAYFKSFIDAAMAYTGTHGSIPTPTTRRPSSSASMFISFYTVMSCVYFVLVLI